MSIRLCMLARDEADRMAGVAAAVGHLIDSWCLLVDDRTTDATARAAADAFRGLPGGPLPFRFHDFAQARNLLFAAARDGLDATDYLLLLDPDTPPEGGIPEELTDPIYCCEWETAGFTWRLPVLVRADVECHYEGACHEVLVGGGPQTFLPNMRVPVPAKPVNPERLAWMASLLEPDAKAGDPRAAYYLAQTLRQLGRDDEAFGWYMRRAQMGHGWFEETWSAVYEAGALVAALDEELAAVLWRRCIALRPGRAEPYWQLARAANSRQRSSEALAWASSGLAVGASTDTLFVNRWIEREGLSEQFNLAAMSLLNPTLVATPTIVED